MNLNFYVNFLGSIKNLLEFYADKHRGFTLFRELQYRLKLKDQNLKFAFYMQPILSVTMAVKKIKGAARQR